MIGFIKRMVGPVFLTVAMTIVPPGSAAEMPKEFKAGAFTFARPADWDWVQTSSQMRAAQLAVRDKTSKEDVEVVFYYFGPGNGGGTEANVNRWLGQFQEPKNKIKSKVEEKKVGGELVTYVQAEGTYMSGPPLGQKVAKPDFMLLGAIMENPQGNVFVKMTGPAERTKAAMGVFKKMVEDALGN